MAKRIRIIDTEELTGKNPLFHHTVETNLTTEDFELYLQQDDPEADCSRLLLDLMRRGFRCSLSGSDILVYAGTVVWGDMHSDDYIASIAVNRAKAVINSEDSDQPGAIEFLSEFLARCGFNDVGIHSGGQK